eukprot:7869006-Ditylum_brightwellii.AAC.1
MYSSRCRAESGRNGRIDEFVMESNGRPISRIWSRSQASSSCSRTTLASNKQTRWGNLVLRMCRHFALDIRLNMFSKSRERRHLH